jgi:hypothetical protein
LDSAFGGDEIGYVDTEDGRLGDGAWDGSWAGDYTLRPLADDENYGFASLAAGFPDNFLPAPRVSDGPAPEPSQAHFLSQQLAPSHDATLENVEK